MEEQKELNHENFMKMFRRCICVKETSDDKINKLDIEHGFGKFKDLFKELMGVSEGIVGGGCMVSMLTGTPINDIDLYVRKSKLAAIIDFMKNSNFFELRSANFGSIYCPSFLRKNNIFVRFRTLYARYVEFIPPIDLIVVDDSIDTPDVLRKVIQSFDLSFCKIYWDGQYMHNLSGIETTGSEGFYIFKTEKLEGTLSDDYMEYYYQGNKFIHNRIRKYTNRGFSIKINVQSYKDKKFTKTLKINNNNELEVKIDKNKEFMNIPIIFNLYKRVFDLYKTYTKEEHINQKIFSINFNNPAEIPDQFKDIFNLVKETVIPVYNGNSKIGEEIKNTLEYMMSDLPEQQSLNSAVDNIKKLLELE